MRSINSIKHRARKLGVQRIEFSAVYQIEPETLKIIAKYDKVTACPYNHTGVIQACQGKMYKAYGYHWCYVSQWSVNWKPIQGKFLRNEKIWCYETDAVYENATAAAQATGLPVQGIRKCVNGYAKSVGEQQYHFCLASRKDGFIKPNNNDERQVVCKNTGQIYSSIAEAARDTGASISGVGGCCRGIYQTSGVDKNGFGLQWCYLENYNQQERVVFKGKTKPVRCIETGVIYISASEASQKLGIARSSIVGCVNKRPHCLTAGGYHWEYVDIEK